MKETNIHFQTERVQSRNKNSKIFGALVALKDLKENGTSVAREYKS